MNPSYEIPNSNWQTITGDNREAGILYDGFFKELLPKLKGGIKTNTFA